MTETQNTEPTDDTAALLSMLEAGLVELRLSSGETLFDQDDFDDRIFVLDAGELEVSVLAPSGRKLSLNRLTPGNVFGEIAILDPGPRTARVKALVPSRLRYVRQSVLLDATVRTPALTVALLGLAGRRMRWMSRQLEEQVFLAPASRLASMILYLASGEGEISMSQAQLADYVGVTREVVSKLLSEWRRAGLVELSRGRIRLLNRSGLERKKSEDF